MSIKFRGASGAFAIAVLIFAISSELKPLSIRLRLSRSGAEGELDLGREALFYPSDIALDGWVKSAQDGRAEVVYD